MSRVLTLLDKLWAFWLLIVLAAYLRLIELPQWLAIAAAISLVIVVGSMILRHFLAPKVRKKADPNG